MLAEIFPFLYQTIFSLSLPFFQNYHYQPADFLRLLQLDYQRRTGFSFLLAFREDRSF